MVSVPIKVEKACLRSFFGLQKRTKEEEFEKPEKDRIGVLTRRVLLSDGIFKEKGA